LKKRKYILLIIALVLSSISRAEVIVLNSGAHIAGEILLQNEEVVIIKKKDGARYQYPRTEVASILEETAESATTTETQNTDTENARKLALTFQVYTGAVYFAHEGWGGQIGTDLMMGSKTIAGTPLFIGGSIGYRAKILADKTYSFIPLQVVLAMPLVKKQHSPHISVSMGYGFLTDKTYKGGLCLSASAGWSYQFNTNSSLLLGAYADLQQTKTNVTETINNQEYTSFKASSFVSIGATIGIKF
jgi:hypothetical protein